MTATPIKRPRAAKKHKEPVRKQLALHLFALPAMVFTLIFAYIPILGLQIAFKDYRFIDGIWGSAWAGFKHFRAFFNDPNIWPVIINTISLSVLKCFVMFPIPILFAILLNEMKAPRYKRVLQTVSYFPYFIAWPVVAMLASYWMSTTGLINDVLTRLGLLQTPYLFLGQPKAFYSISIVLDIMKTMGYSSIVFLSAISAVDTEQIEASVIDGAGRAARIWYIIIPAMLPTISTILILNIGSMLNGGLYASNFQISYNLGNSLNISKSEILETYILKIGITNARFSYATAVGFINSLVAAVLLVLGNFATRKLTGESIV